MLLCLVFTVQRDEAIVQRTVAGAVEWKTSRISIDTATFDAMRHTTDAMTPAMNC